MKWAMNSKRTIKWKLFDDEAAYQLWNHVKSTEDFELLFLIARLYLFETKSYGISIYLLDGMSFKLFVV